MDVESAIRARLTVDPGVTAVVAQRVYWIDRPQLQLMPAITLQIIDDSRDQNMDGFQTMQFLLVQVDVWANNYAEGKAIKEAVIATLTPKATANAIAFGTATNIRTRDLSEQTETQFIYRPSLEFKFNYTAA